MGTGSVVWLLLAQGLAWAAFGASLGRASRSAPPVPVRVLAALACLAILWVSLAVPFDVMPGSVWSAAGLAVAAAILAERRSGLARGLASLGWFLSALLLFWSLLQAIAMV